MDNLLAVKMDIRERRRLEKMLARKLGRMQRSWFDLLIKVLGDPPRIENITPAFWAKVGRELAGAVGPSFEEIFLDQARELMLDLPIGVDWALVNEAAIEFARRYSFELVKGVNQYSERTIRKALVNYYERQQTIGDLQRSISHLYGPTRAEAIAVTEITRSAAEGEYAIAKELRQQGVEMIGFWQTNEDELVCPICKPLNDKKAAGYDALERPYWIHPQTGEQYQHPAHPRCRCFPRFELPNKLM